MTNADTARWHTRESAAEYLGTTTRSIDKMVAAGRLEPTYFGASKRFRAAQLDSLVTPTRQPVTGRALPPGDAAELPESITRPIVRRA
jgi:excisionase family DNA binding protein